MYSELISLADNGRLYGWSWANGQKPSNVPHLVNANFLGKGKLFRVFLLNMFVL